MGQTGTAVVPPLTTALADDGDEYMLAIPGVTGRLTRTGLGSGLTRVTVGCSGPVRLALLDVGFPIVGDAAADSDSLVLVRMLRTPPGGVWDGVDLTPGRTFVYPPGSTQQARDPDGLVAGLVTVPWSQVHAAATTLGLSPEAGRRVTHAWPGRLSAAFHDLWRHSSRSGMDGAVELGSLSTPDELLEAVARFTCASSADESIGTRRPDRRRWECRDIVDDALGHLERIETWRVPLLTLCREVGVSERRLQYAFRRVYDQGPNEFMRTRALQAAHRALAEADPTATSVAGVAAAHGFRHHGRFAAYHRAVYGEAPQITLNRPSSRALRRTGRGGPSAGDVSPRAEGDPSAGDELDRHRPTVEVGLGH